jgi:membrane fusion protein, multidrug efflux system
MDAAQATYDGANAALKSAEAQLAAARDGKTQAVTRVTEAEGRFSVAKPIEAQIAAAQAQALAADARAQSSQAALDLAKLQRSYARVTASLDGFVSRVKLEPGDLLAPGQTVMELVPKAVYIEANFKETQIGNMKPGQLVGITIDALGSRKFKGKVESLSGGTGARFSLLPPDNASGNFVKVVQRLPVRIGFVDLPADVRLPAGLSVDVTVHEE